MVSLARLIAWGLILFGLFRVAAGFYVATYFVDQPSYEAATARYIGSGTTGEAIDQGLVLIAIGVGIGVLARIAAGLSKASRRG